MSLISNDWDTDVTRKRVHRTSSIHKFGHSGNITTVVAPLSNGNVYQTPTSAAALEILSDNVNDTSAGTGAQAITVEGLDANWEPQEEVIELNGLTAVDLVKTYTRVFRAWVSRSGTYADAATPSHVGTITVRGNGAGVSWILIDATEFPVSQSACAVYTVPLGYKAVIRSLVLNVASAKVVDFWLFQRPHCNDVTPPYSGTMRIIYQAHALAGPMQVKPKSPWGEFIGPCDLGFMCKVATGTGDASADFEIQLIKDR